MITKSVFGFWFSLLVECFLVCSGQTQVPKAAPCLKSSALSLVRESDWKDTESCWTDCLTERDCHMAVVVRGFSRSEKCLLVNCLNQGKYSYHRHPGQAISVSIKRTFNKGQRNSHREDAHQPAPVVKCHVSDEDASCQTGAPKFYYNHKRFRCESFLSGCGSNANALDTREDCEAVCNEKFLCYRPMAYGVGNAYFDKFFYNVTSQMCEGFVFRGQGSNGNIFDSVEECEGLCRGVKATDTVTDPSGGAVGIVVALVIILVLVVVLFCLCFSRRSVRSQDLLTKINHLWWSQQGHKQGHKQDHKQDMTLIN